MIAGPTAPTDPLAAGGAARGPLGRRRVARIRVVSRPERLAIGTVAIVAMLVFWQFAADEHWINPLAASSPSAIWHAAGSLISTGVLGKAVAETAGLFGVGFGFSLLVGLGVGIVVGWNPRVDAAVDPFVSILYAAPRIALTPLITVWVGIGFTAQVVIVFLTAVFPIIINVAAGVRTLDRNCFNVARSFLGTNIDVLRTVALPGAVPSIISGVRQGLAQALIGVVVAEYFVGQNGVGGLIVASGFTLNTANAFVGVFVFAGASLVLTGILKAFAQRADRWRI